MIFTTVGMHHQGFDRLISAMDELAAEINEEIIMQIGAAAHEPANAKWFRFADSERVDALMAAARVVVAHAGAGTIIGAFRHRRPVVVVPRRAAFNEHVDDHQLDLAQALASEGKVALVIDPRRSTLLAAIEKAMYLRAHENASQRLAAAVSNILVNSG